MTDTLHSVLLFLINTVFDLYLFVVTIRIILVWVKSSYFFPTTQVVLKLTDFFVKPLKKFLPNIGRVETASVVLLLVLEVIKFLFICLLSFGWPHITGLVLLVIGDAFKMFLETFFYAILIQVVISWMQPNSPIYFIIRQVTSPILQPLQRIIPLVGGMDITPIPALILLQLLIIVGQGVMQEGLLLALGT
jgi:YggT family protein